MDPPPNNTPPTLLEPDMHADRPRMLGDSSEHLAVTFPETDRTGLVFLLSNSSHALPAPASQLPPALFTGLHTPGPTVPPASSSVPSAHNINPSGPQEQPATAQHHRLSLPFPSITADRNIIPPANFEHNVRGTGYNPSTTGFGIGNDIGVASSSLHGEQSNVRADAIIPGASRSTYQIPQGHDSSVPAHLAQLEAMAPGYPTYTISEVLHRYRTLHPDIQEALRAEFLSQIERYSSAVCSPNVTPAANSFQGMGHRYGFGQARAQLNTATQPQAQAQMQPHTQPQPMPEPLFRIRRGAQTAPEAQLQVHQHPNGLAQVPSDAHATRHREVDARATGKFLNEQPVNRSAFGIPNVPAMTGILLTTESPAELPVLSNASTLIAAAATGNAKAGREQKDMTPKPPSKYCHICGRNSPPVVACGNIAAGNCRKIICKRCFTQTDWDGKIDFTAARLLGDNWECTHCVGVCPTRAQCFTYARSIIRRRLRREAAAAANAHFDVHPDNEGPDNEGPDNEGPDNGILVNESHLSEGHNQPVYIQHPVMQPASSQLTRSAVTNARPASARNAMETSSNLPSTSCTVAVDSNVAGSNLEAGTSSRSYKHLLPRSSAIAQLTPSEALPIDSESLPQTTIRSRSHKNSFPEPRSESPAKRRRV